MHIILGIHCMDVQTDGVVRLMKQLEKSGEKTIFINFPFPALDFSLQKLESLLPPELQSRIREANYEKHMDTNRTRYGGYVKSLVKTLKTLEAELGEKETIKTIGVGGCDDICFKNINMGAQKEIRTRFRKRVVKQMTYLPLVYGGEHNFPNRFWGKTTTAANRLKRMREKKQMAREEIVKKLRNHIN